MSYNQNSKKNLVEPWKPGKSGNPKGHPKGMKNRSTIAKAVLGMPARFPKQTMEKLKSIFPDITERMSIEEVMAIMQAGKAVAKGDTEAYRALMDSAYGKPKETVDMKDARAGKYSGMTLEELRAEKAKRTNK